MKTGQIKGKFSSKYQPDDLTPWRLVSISELGIETWERIKVRKDFQSWVPQENER